METRLASGLVVAVALVAACGGIVESSATADRSALNPTPTPQDVGLLAPTGGLAVRPSIARPGGARLVGRIETDGSIVTDGTNVYWTAQEIAGTPRDPDFATPYSIVYCPVVGCGSDGPVTFASHVNGGVGVGELVVAAGRLYFQSGPAEDSSRGPIVDCPLTGCGSEPAVFASIDDSFAFSALLTTDGASLFWEDRNDLYSCPLGAACENPTVLARSIGNTPASSVALELVVSGGRLYWVAPGAAVMSVSTSGGPTTTICSARDESDSGGLGWGMLAVLDGYVYVSGLGHDIQRCPLDGGEAESYASGSLMLWTDGALLYWLTDWGQSGDATTYLNACAPGASCADAARLVGLDGDQGIGLTFDRDWIYTVAGTVQRTRR